MKRRKFLKLNISLFSIYASLYLTGCGDTSASNPDPKNVLNTKPLFKRPPSGLFDVSVEGSIPSDLKGTLYRNGPSLFERKGVNKGHILDGDGFITKLSINNSQVEFTGEFIQTEKFIAEENAGEFLFDTWTFTNPHNDFGVLDKKNKSNQSSVSVKYIDGKLYSFEESLVPYEINKDDLSSKLASGSLEKLQLHSAHGKKDLKTGDFVNFGIQYGDRVSQGFDQLHHYLHIHTINKDKIKFYKKIELGGILNKNKLNGLYFHDFFLTDNYIIFHLQPLFTDIRSLYPLNETFGENETSLAGGFRWDGSKNNKILIVNRHNPKADTIIVNTPSVKAWWHGSNAYEKDNNIILDLIAYDKFDFFDKNSNVLANITDGSIDKSKAKLSPSYPLRHIISLSGSSPETETYTKGEFVSEKILNNKFNCEFPTINNAYLSKENKFFYATIGGSDAYLNGIGKFDNSLSQWSSTYLFPKDHIGGEPIFCQKDNSTDEDDGYIISTIHNLNKKLSFVAIFDAKDISKGPISTINLNTSLPFRLHGEWVDEK